MLNNPEIKRYIWLDCAPQRLLVMAIVMALIFYIIADKTMDGMHATGMGMYFLIVLLMGGNAAAESVLDELKNRTWDWQRLSSMTPWQLTVGKVFGSPIFAWCSAVIPMLVVLATFHPNVEMGTRICTVVLMLAAAVFCHASTILSSLQSLQSGRNRVGRAHALLQLAVGLVAGGQIMFAATRFDAPPTVNDHGTMVYNEAFNSIVWYGASWNAPWFITVLGVVMTAWAVFGVYWHMRGQLMERTGPWVWGAFVVFVMVLLSGFSISERALGDVGLSRSIMVLLPVAIISLYYMAFSEGWSGVSYRRLIGHWRAKRWKDVEAQFPRWVVSMALVLVAALISAVMVGRANGIAMIVLLVSYSVRDIAVLHYLSLKPSIRRVSGGMLLYCLVIYMLIPMLLQMAGLGKVAQLMLPLGAGAFTVDLPENALFAIGFGLLQAVIPMLLVARVWRQHWRG